MFRYDVVATNKTVGYKAWDIVTICGTIDEAMAYIHLHVQRDTLRVYGRGTLHSEFFPYPNEVIDHIRIEDMQ